MRGRRGAVLIAMVALVAACTGGSSEGPPGALPSLGTLPGPITGDPKYDTRPEDAFNSYKALRAMNPDILISGHPQNLFKGKLEALWANKRPSPLALAPGQWAKMVDDSEANYKKRLGASTASSR